MRIEIDDLERSQVIALLEGHLRHVTTRKRACVRFR